MINKTELRIGNFLVDTKENVSTRIGIGDLIVINQFPDRYVPIPLTEEWLLKLGFGKCEEHSLSKEISDRLSIIYDWHFKMLYLIITSPHNEQQIGLTHIEHVHELQNFWHSLAAEELTINDFSPSKT